jgi:Domain of unknown function (DUF4417)
MLMPVEVLTPPLQSSQRQRTLWHDASRFSVSLGCTICPDRRVCGGLQVESAVFNCLSLCCGNPTDCDAVCRNNPQKFAERVREVDGFTLNNVPRAPVRATPQLPKLVPVLFHGDRRRRPFQSSAAVCLPLYKVIARHDGHTRYANRAALAAGFGIPSTTSVILTGTAIDPPLERWWSLGPERLDAIRALRDIGIAMVTTPNFSLFTDQPRWDDLHSMKRIALVHEEFLREGLPAALHVNARTDRDWERWIDYIGQRPEVTHIAFEFGTGAGWPTRIQWHTDQLLQLGAAVGRPLHLVLRGGTEVLPMLVAGFRNITFLETTTFPKTVHRQRAELMANGSVSWRLSPTARNEGLDDLLAHNWETVARSHEGIFESRAEGVRAIG